MVELLITLLIIYVVCKTQKVKNRDVLVAVKINLRLFNAKKSAKM